MNDIITALEALTDRDPNGRDVAVDTLGDLLCGTALDTDTARLVVGRLVSLTVNEPVTKVRESALNATGEAFNHHRLPLDLVEPLAVAMPTPERELLEHCLYILGATHDPKARLLVDPFLHHLDPQVREAARLAASEITASERPTHSLDSCSSVPTAVAGGEHAPPRRLVRAGARFECGVLTERTDGAAACTGYPAAVPHGTSEIDRAGNLAGGHWWCFKCAASYCPSGRNDPSGSTVTS
ncbi:hypothetical protein [Kitasatospora sp. NPDC088783]|uniref:hypothetical protein n=1 Tax=Kitasatospora sp. NPDC088783 TaxID=3364077 RepID=UPI00380C6B52